MPEVARGNEVDVVKSPDGGGPNGDGNCPAPTIQATNKCSQTVFVETIGVVRQLDTMKKHPGVPGCVPHAPALSKFSGTVYVEGKGLGRKGDDYGGHGILTGSSTVFAGG